MESLPRWLARRIVREWADYHVSQSAAAVAFYTLLSLAPVLVFATAAATAFLSRDEAQQLVKEQLAETVGPGAADVAGTVRDSEGFLSGGLIATPSSGVLLPFGSSAVFVKLRRTLDRIFGGGPTGETPFLLRFLLGRLFSNAFAIVGGLFLVATLLGSAVFNSVADRLALLTGTPTAWWAQFSQALSFGEVAIVLLAVLAWLPSRPPPLRWVLVGVGLSTALFELGKWVARFERDRVRVRPEQLARGAAAVGLLFHAHHPARRRAEPRARGGSRSGQLRGRLMYRANDLG